MSETAPGNTTFVKWLKILLCAAIVDAVAATLSHFSSILTFLSIWPANLTFLTTWPAALAGLVKTLVLLRLCTLNARYKKAGIFRLCALLLPLGAGIRYAGLVFSLAALVFSLLAAYQEYRGHGEMSYKKDLNLADQWFRLFEWTIILAFVFGFAGAGLSWLLGRIEMNATLQTFLQSAVFAVPELLVSVFLYIRYLRETIRVFSENV